MSRTRFLFVLLATALCLAQTGSELISPDIKRVGMKLACLCGTCKNTVGDCAMLECHYSKPRRTEIAAMLGEKKTDEQIIQATVDQFGRQALAVPPMEGFHLLAWTMPYAFAGLGLGVIVWYVRRQMKRRPAALPEVDPAVLDSIDKDLAKLD